MDWVFNRSKVDIMRFAMSYFSSLISDPGSACERNDRLSSAFGPHLFQGRLATNQCTAAAEVMLKGGHKTPNGCRP